MPMEILQYYDIPSLSFTNKTGKLVIILKSKL